MVGASIKRKEMKGLAIYSIIVNALVILYAFGSNSFPTILACIVLYGLVILFASLFLAGKR